MPIAGNLYVDDISVKTLVAKARTQVNQTQTQQTAQTTVVDEDELPGWGTHPLNDPAIIVIRRRYGSEAYVKDLEAMSSPPQPKPNVFATQVFLQTGKELNPDVEVPD